MFDFSIPTNSRIIYYQGTFDPVHNGHVSALETAMEVTKASLAIVVVDDGENAHKPSRTSWERRVEMASIVFPKLKNVYLSTESKTTLRNRLIEKAYVINLIGSDIWTFYSKKETIPFQGICVCLRNGETSIEPTSLGDKEITLITPPVKGCSSTKIRNYFYTNLHDTPDFLDPEVIEYIFRNNIYQSVIGRLKCYIPTHSVTCLSGGKSGDLTFLAANQEQKIFIKSYVRKTHKIDFGNEIGGIKLLNNLSLKWCQTVGTIYWEETKDHYSHIGVPFLEKNDLAKVFKNFDDNFVRMCFYAGRALSELHSASSAPMDISRFNEFTAKLNARVQDCNEDESVKMKFADTHAKFRLNPGVHTYAHGDANLSNFIVDVDTGKVILVDLDRLYQMRSKSGTPLGFPAEDYYRFLFGIPWLNQQINFSSNIVLEAQHSFKEGYNTYPSSITIEAHEYFYQYWSLRNSYIEQ